MLIYLTHWGQETHICVNEHVNIGRCKAIIWTNAGMLLVGHLGTNFSERLIEIIPFHPRKCIWKYRLENGGHFFYKIDYFLYTWKLFTIIVYSPRTLTLKRPGLCGWLRPTQFKPRLDWVGSAAQVRRYCVGSAAQAFIHALAGCVSRSLQCALCGPRNSRPAHFAAHALDVLATNESPSLTQLST